MNQQEFSYALKIIKEGTGSNSRDGLVSVLVGIDDTDVHCRH